MQELCRRHEILLVADEVVTGFGRLGSWFASQRYGITPDMVTGAKGVTSGYVPLGVVLCGDRVRSMLWKRSAGPLRHGYTYSGHAVAAAVGLRNLEIIELERLRVRVTELEPVLARELETLSSHPLVTEVRSVGLLGGVQLDAQALDKNFSHSDDLLAFGTDWDEKFAGWKQFYKPRNDSPRTTIAEILRLHPRPVYIQYQ